MWWWEHHVTFTYETNKLVQMDGKNMQKYNKQTNIQVLELIK